MSSTSLNLLRNFELSAYASLNAKPRLGVNERVTQTVLSARQGMSEADNDVSAMQWELAMSFSLLLSSAR